MAMVRLVDIAGEGCKNPHWGLNRFLDEDVKVTLDPICVKNKLYKDKVYVTYDLNFKDKIFKFKDLLTNNILNNVIETIPNEEGYIDVEANIYKIKQEYLYLAIWQIHFISPDVTEKIKEAYVSWKEKLYAE